MQKHWKCYINSEKNKKLGVWAKMDRDLKEMTRKLVAFRDERDWHQYHKPKDLAISLSLEAAELLECFQWKSEEKVRAFLESGDRIRLQEEIADVGAYLLLLCHEAGIDLFAAMEDKLVKNAEKYPAELCRGSAKKYNELKGQHREENGR